MAEQSDPAGVPGVDRRALVKRAAAAGALAWTAPLIVDSLASPAAAATVAPGAYRYVLDCNSGGDCAPAGFPVNSLPGDCTVGGSCPGNNQSASFTLSGCPTCSFTAASANRGSGGSPGGTCVSGTVAGTSATFAAPGAGQTLRRFWFVVTCT